MSFAGKVWRLLVGIKDALALLFLLLFFAAIFAILSARPSPGQVREGALLLELDGVIVEERSEIDPIEALLSQEAPIGEYPVRELVQVLDAAQSDDRIEAVVLDLSRFVGGGHVHMQEVAEAVRRVRDSGKPVFTYAVGYADDAMMLASHASEVWLDPLGGAIIAGPGGTNLYYADLLEKLGVNARIYRVGSFKSAVEPFSRNSMSDEARENYRQLYGALWQEWQANVKAARPKLQLDRVTQSPAEWVEASSGDLAEAALDAGLVDRLGSYEEFGARVAEVAGEHPWDNAPGTFATTDYAPFVADTAPDKPGKAIGVVTVSGEIVDGDAGPAVAGGDRIAELLDEALDDDLAGLVVRVNSPGGSVMASEVIRRAILRHKANEIPIAISMGNLAASGGYWVSTAGDRIFAQPETITGSIGVFAVIPTFEGTAAELGVNADGYRTTPLSGQPDLVAGFTPEVDSILQSSVGNTYADFIQLVSEARNLSPERVDAIAQGRVWDGGAAKQLGLVDNFGGINEALAWVAKEAELEDGDWHARYLGTQVNQYDTLLRRLMRDNSQQQASNDLFAMIAGQQTALKIRIAGDTERLLGTRGVQAYCLACPSLPGAGSNSMSPSWLQQLLVLLKP
ncbi:protease-4 [Altererythrobacter xiamenensis]|uniref:Protease-4 n=1 Tax=Altererythrobacter xiamenensis TaxID=1316679 RepID=A0A1Y6EN92_9SPHN|nr:signal peptide peptidase SppA [Altererythrobacter xiamenensis]SMQ62681.1 protease-4 [Altererythrobacter xiamenensis]